MYVMTVTHICMKQKIKSRRVEVYCLVNYVRNVLMVLLLQVGQRVLPLSLMRTAMLMPH